MDSETAPQWLPTLCLFFLLLLLVWLPALSLPKRYGSDPFKTNFWLIHLWMDGRKAVSLKFSHCLIVEIASLVRH